MFSKIDDGKLINIQGLDCWLPPEGYVYNNLTRKLEYIGVYERDSKKENQYWERFSYPLWYKEVTKKEDEYLKNKKEEWPPFYDEKYEQFKQQEWNRRLNGFWFSNNGEAIYLTGFYYMLLQWFNIDVGYAKFILPHLYKLYFLQYCIEDPLCMGMIDITKRRFLKTFIGGLFILEYVTRTKMANGQMQSKTGNDAKKVFQKAIVYPFRKFPRFFRPEYDMSLGINPKTEIRFQQTNVRGKKAEDALDKDELGSVIDWGSADYLHYDGQKSHRYFGDEWAKTYEANVFDRHEVVRYCLLDEEGKIIGKALYSSTVEKLETDKEGIQEAARQLWDASDQNYKKENGMTESGLYRFFQTADEGRNFDVYGKPDIEKTINQIIIDRRTVENNPRALSARIHKEPRTIEEAWLSDNENCIFNFLNLNEREKYLRKNPVFKRKIIFFRDLESQKVKWRDATKSEEIFCWEITEDFIDESISNKFYFDGGLQTPSNKKIGAITVDSYGNSQGGQKYGSKASAWIGIRFDMSKVGKSGKAVAHLYGRPKEKDMLHEQVLLASEYCGFITWYEFAADDYYGYFRDRGRQNYLGIFPLSTIEPTKRENSERHRGFPTTPFSLTMQNDAGVWYVENHVDLIDWIDFLEKLKKYDPYNRTKSDEVVSWLMMLVVITEPIKEAYPRKQALINIYKNENYKQSIAI